MVESGSNISYFYNYKPILSMLTFIGDYPCKLDAKGRVLLPSAFRKLLAASSEDRFVLRKNLYEDCLDLFPVSEWNRQLAMIRSRLNPFNRKHATFLREFYRGTAEMQIDGNGRILIPKKLSTAFGASTILQNALTVIAVMTWSRRRMCALYCMQIRSGFRLPEMHRVLHALMLKRCRVESYRSKPGTMCSPVVRLKMRVCC